MYSNTIKLAKCGSNNKKIKKDKFKIKDVKKRNSQKICLKLIDYAIF